MERRGDGLESGLRSVPQHVAVDAGRGNSDRGHARRARVPAHQGALGGDSRADQRARRGDLRLRHAGEDGGARRAQRRPLRAPADRLDRPQHHLPLPADRGERLVQGAAGFDRPHHGGSTPAAAADRVQLRRVLRGCRRVRHAGGGDRRDPDRPRLLAARRLRPLADRQYRARSLWRARLTDHRARSGDRPRSAASLVDGRAPTAVLLPPCAVLADLGIRRLAWHEGDLARDPGGRGQLRDPAIPRVELPRPMAGGRGGRLGVDGLPRAVPPDLAAGQDLDVSGTQGTGGRIGCARSRSSPETRATLAAVRRGSTTGGR